MRYIIKLEQIGLPTSWMWGKTEMVVWPGVEGPGEPRGCEARVGGLARAELSSAPCPSHNTGAQEASGEGMNRVPSVQGAAGLNWKNEEICSFI